MYSSNIHYLFLSRIQKVFYIYCPLLVGATTAHSVQWPTVEMVVCSIRSYFHV